MDRLRLIHIHGCLERSNLVYTRLPFSPIMRGSTWLQLHIVYTQIWPTKWMFWTSEGAWLMRYTKIDHDWRVWLWKKRKPLATGENNVPGCRLYLHFFKTVRFRWRLLKGDNVGCVKTHTARKSIHFAMCLYGSYWTEINQLWKNMRRTRHLPSGVLCVRHLGILHGCP